MSKHCVGHLLRFAALGVVVFLAGCGPKQLARKETYPVQGKLTFQGKPGAFVIVRLEPVEMNKGVAAEGTTDEDGNFELRTYVNDGMDGAAAGEYKVVLEEHDPVRAGPLPKGAKATPIPGGEMETDFRVEIRAAANPAIDVNIP